MVKVELKHVELFANWKLMREMRAWCRDQFGKNLRHMPAQWRGTYVFRDRMRSSIGYYPVFFFASERQATLFVLRWS